MARPTAASLDDATLQILARQLQSSIQGEVRFDRGSRALYATDGSLYRYPPLGVVIPRCEEDVIRTLAICREALAEYVSWVFHQQALQPAIHAIRDTFERIRVQEIERHHGRFSTMDREELDRLTTSMIQKLLAVPVVRLKSVDPESIDFVRGIKLLRALFSRPECEDESAAEPASADAGRMLLPSRCPFELPGDAALPEDPRQALHEALRSPARLDRGK